MKRWKQAKEQLDAKRNASNSHKAESSRPAPLYQGAGISSASFSDLRELRSGQPLGSSHPSSSSLVPPMKKSESRTSLDIPGRFSNLLSKSASSLELSSAAAGYNKAVGNALRKFPRPRTRSTSNSFGNTDAASTSSPSKITSPRKWVNSLLDKSAPVSQQLETAAQARFRAQSDASRPSPAPVSSLVLSPSGHAISPDPPTSRQVYTIDSGLQRIPSVGARSASIYSSHLSSASRSTPDLHQSSVTRHRNNGALLMDLTGPLPPITHRKPPPTTNDTDSPLLVRNLDEAPRGTYTPAIPNASASAQLQAVPRLRNPWSVDSPQIQSEEDDEIDASIAHDRITNQLGLGEQAVLDMLDSASGVGTAVSAPVPPTPYQTATPGTLARSRSFATTAKFDSPASEYSQDFRSPFLAGTSSPGAAVREAIRQRELLDSTAANRPVTRSQIPASRSALSAQTSAFLHAVGSDDTQPLRSSQTSSASFYQRSAPTTASDQKGASVEALAKRISRVPVPTTEKQIASPPASETSNILVRRGTTVSGVSQLPISPMDSSLAGSSAHATSLWSRPSNTPDTPSTTQDPTSPMPWSASLAPPKWRSTAQQGQHGQVERQKSLYALEPVVTPSEVGKEEGQLSDVYHSSSGMPDLRRHRTDFTEATSIFSGAEAFRSSQNSLHKESTAETEATAAMSAETAAEATTALSALTPDAAASRPLSHVGSVSSSLAAIRGMFSKATSSVLPSTSSAPTSTASAIVSPTRPTTVTDAAPSTTSVAAAARELEQRSIPSRPSTAEKLSIPSSPTKAKDLIKMFESNSATASPTDQSHSFSRTNTPRSKLSPTKCGTSTADSLTGTPKRQTPLTISLSRSNLGLAASNTTSDLTPEQPSPISAKLRAQRVEAGRFRSRRAGLIGVGAEGFDGGIGGHPDDFEDEGADENAAPECASSGGDVRNAQGRLRTFGLASQHPRSQSSPSEINGNVLGRSSQTSPAGQSPSHGRRCSHGSDGKSGSLGSNQGSLSRKGALRSSVMGFMGVLSGKQAGTSAAGRNEPGPDGQTLAPEFLAERRHSNKSDQDENASTASAATQGTTASYRRRKEEGNLPLNNDTAIQMSGEQPGTKPLRAGVLYYFNVHDNNPRWLRVKAVLLPTAIAMSWIPTGGGRENVVLDLRACREVHSVPNPDHPSSASDVGAACARRQGLDQISPFQLIFDDGVERLAADTAKERVQWVTSVWDVTGTGSPRPDSVPDSALASSGHDDLSKSGRTVRAQVSPANRAKLLTDSISTRPFISSLGAGVQGSPKRPTSTRHESSSNEEAIDRIGSIWKSELSSELTNKDLQPSFGEALASAAPAPPPLPPKEQQPARERNLFLPKTKSIKSEPTTSLPNPHALTLPPPSAASAPLPTTAASSSPARSKVRSWQRQPLDLSTGFVHDVTPKTPTLVTPAADAIHSTPASYAEDKSTTVGSARASAPEESLAVVPVKVSERERDPVAMAVAGDVSPAASSPDMDGYESARSQSSLVDEFGPRTPVSDAVFHWSRLDKESELNPSDSASQRPARSEFGTIKSNASAAERKRSTRKQGDEVGKVLDGSSEPDALAALRSNPVRTPAQLLRDSVLGASAESPNSTDALFNGSPTGRSNRLGTVIEETQSQAQSSRPDASIRSSVRSKMNEVVARAIGNGSVNSPAAKSALSLVSSGSISSHDVGKLLEFLEEQQRERLSKEKALEDQIRNFQQLVSDLQKKNSTSSSHRSARRRSSTSTTEGDSRVTAKSSRDSELAAMQEKLDKVLDLVTNVVASPAVHKRAKGDSATVMSTPLLGEDADSAELARVEAVLAKVLRKMQASEEAAMTPRSKELVRAAISSRDPGIMDEWDRMPVELRGSELIKSMEDRAKFGKDGRHEVIQSDYTMGNLSPSMVRGLSAPAGALDDPGTPVDADFDPKRRFSASLPRRASGVSIPATSLSTDADGASMMSRIPPRSWSSERGVPSPPPNSEWDAKSIISRPASRATTHTGFPARTPTQNFRMLGDTRPTQAVPRPVMVKNEPSYGSLDMEAEIRRRRAQQRAASGTPVPAAQQGGWYTPKVVDGAEQQDPQASSSSVTVQAANLDKPVPPTPGVRWAVGDVVPTEAQAGTGAEKTPDGLGLSMSAAAVGEAKFAGPPPTPGVGYVSSAASVSGGSAVGTASGELATILQALKQSELARQTQLQQQTEISRYLNELNAWLERDVVDRSKEWRTLASGVTQLHDELKAIKEGKIPIAGSTLSAATANSDAANVSAPMEPLDPTKPAVPNPHAAGQLPSLLRPGTTGAGPAVTERGHLAPIPYGGPKITTLSDSGNGTDSPNRRRPTGTRKWNERRSESPSANDADNSWYKPDDAADTGATGKSSFKSKAARAAAAASGALLIRQALREWERAAGKPEDPLPAEATGDPAIDSQLPLPAARLQQLKDAADQEDNFKVGELIRECAEAGYGTQAIIELTNYVESKAPEPESSEEDEGERLDGDTLMPTPSPYRTRFAVEDEPEEPKSDDGFFKMQSPVPSRVAAAKERSKSKADAVAEEEHEEGTETGSGPTTAALALAVEEILKHLLSTKEEAKKKQTEAEAREAERKAAETERERSLLSMKEREKAELVDLLYSRIAADKAAEEAKQKELDPKSAIESLVAAINSQKEVEVKSAAVAESALRQMTSELLKSTSEQNRKLVEAVNAASRDMLKSNVQMHADEFKRLLHKEVSGMFEDVGKIREAKRHLEFEIADLWGIKNRHLQQNAIGMPMGGMNVPGGYPGSPAPVAPPAVGAMGMGMSMPMPVPQITHIHHSPIPAHPPAHISPIPPPGTVPWNPALTPVPAAGVESLKAQKKAVKAALKQAEAEAIAPIPAAVAPPPAQQPLPAQGFLTKRKDLLNPFSINFGPRAPIPK